MVFHETRTKKYLPQKLQNCNKTAKKLRAVVLSVFWIFLFRKDYSLVPLIMME